MVEELGKRNQQETGPAEEKAPSTEREKLAAIADRLSRYGTERLDNTSADIQSLMKQALAIDEIVNALRNDTLALAQGQCERHAADITDRHLQVLIRDELYNKGQEFYPWKAADDERRRARPPKKP